MKKYLVVPLGVLLLSCFAVQGVNAHVEGTMRPLRLQEGLEREQREQEQWAEVEDISPAIEMEQVFAALNQTRGAEEVMRTFQQEAEPFAPGPSPVEKGKEPPGRLRPGEKPAPPGRFPTEKIALLTPNSPTNPAPWKAYLDLWGIDAFAGYSNLSKQYRRNQVAYLNPKWSSNTPRGAGQIDGWFLIPKAGWYLFAAKVCGGGYGIDFNVSVDNNFYGSFKVIGVDVICIFTWLPAGYWHKIQLDHTGGWGWFISLKAWKAGHYEAFQFWKRE